MQGIGLYPEPYLYSPEYPAPRLHGGKMEALFMMGGGDASKKM